MLFIFKCEGYEKISAADLVKNVWKKFGDGWVVGFC